MLNIIARRTLLAYCRLYPAAAVALQQWYAEMIGQDFSPFNQLKASYATASLVGGDRVVFNIMRNKYRLVVRFVFAYRAVQIKWFGTHQEYDQIDIATVSFRAL